MTNNEQTKKTTSRVASVIGVFIAALLVVYSLLTGADPLEVFADIQLTPTSANVLSTPVQPTAVVSQPNPTIDLLGPNSSAWWQVYFTDPLTINNPKDLSGSIPEVLIAYISNAQRSIHIASFEFNLTPVAEALIAAHQRGIDVRWVTDDEYGLEADEFEEDHGQFAMLQQAGITVQDDGRSALMHNKFWIFDEQIVWTGSTNITVNGNFRNNNNVIVIYSQEVAAAFEAEFAEMWAGGFGPRSPSGLAQQSFRVKSTDVDVLFAPEDNVISHLLPLIENAQQSIRFMAFSFTHDDLQAAMQARAAAGVDLKGIFETRGSETEYSALPAMFCAKLDVRQDGNPGTFHHKVIVIDNRILITGSLNFSENADSSNDENVVVIANSRIAGQYLKEFERRWVEAQSPDPADMGCK